MNLSLWVKTCVEVEVKFRVGLQKNKPVQMISIANTGMKQRNNAITDRKHEYAPETSGEERRDVSSLNRRNVRNVFQIQTGSVGLLLRILNYYI
jgi:hypothetical protein